MTAARPGGAGCWPPVAVPVSVVAPHQEITGNAMTLLHPTAPNPNTYANNPLDRVSHLRTDLGWLADRLRDPDSRIVPFWRLHPFILAAPQPQTMAEVGW